MKILCVEKGSELRDTISERFSDTTLIKKTSSICEAVNLVGIEDYDCIVLNGINKMPFGNKLIPFLERTNCKYVDGNSFGWMDRLTKVLSAKV